MLAQTLDLARPRVKQWPKYSRAQQKQIMSKMGLWHAQRFARSAPPTSPPDG